MTRRGAKTNEKTSRREADDFPPPGVESVPDGGTHPLSGDDQGYDDPRFRVDSAHFASKKIVNVVLPLIRALRSYHNHSVLGLEHIPRVGRGLLVVNHSLATYDIAMLLEAIYTNTQRECRLVADHLFFKFPYIRDWVTDLGGVDGNTHNAHRLLGEEQVVCVAPGGMVEALRPSAERYQLRWERRRGFARLAVETGSPVIIALCPKADDIYEVYPTAKMSKWFYKNFHVPFFLARGLGPTPLPRPVTLTHFIAAPLHPPKIPEGTSLDQQDQIVRNFHREVVDAADRLMAKAVAYRR